jgi:hypothetical protein
VIFSLFTYKRMRRCSDLSRKPKFKDLTESYDRPTRSIVVYDRKKEEKGRMVVFQDTGLVSDLIISWRTRINHLPHLHRKNNKKMPGLTGIKIPFFDRTIDHGLRVPQTL